GRSVLQLGGMTHITGPTEVGPTPLVPSSPTSVGLTRFLQSEELIDPGIIDTKRDKRSRVDAPGWPRPRTAPGRKRWLALPCGKPPRADGNRGYRIARINRHASGRFGMTSRGSCDWDPAI